MGSGAFTIGHTGHVRGAPKQTMKNLESNTEFSDLFQETPRPLSAQGPSNIMAALCVEG